MRINWGTLVMIKRIATLAAGLLAASALTAQAQQTCGGTYKVRPGDSLSLIADKLYKDVGQWTVIYRSNIDVISKPDSIRVGQVYRLPCIGGLPAGLPDGQPYSGPQQTGDTVVAAVVPGDTAVQSREERQRSAAKRQRDTVRLLASDEFRPFTNRLQLSSGLISDIVNRAFVNADGIGEHQFYWVNDRAVHLDPMVSEGMVDVAFPWTKPDCTATPGLDLCTDYVFSEPMFEMLEVLFTDRQSDVRYTGEQDLADMRVCAPLGYHSAARSGNTGVSYLAKAGARLQQPPSAEDCFERLVSGSADAVVMNEFTGRVVLKDMDLDDRIELQLGRPLAIVGLHAVAHRSNPDAAQIITSFNAGLEKMRQSGEYVGVIDKHMSIIWSGL